MTSPIKDRLRTRKCNLIKKNDNGYYVFFRIPLIQIRVLYLKRNVKKYLYN